MTSRVVVSNVPLVLKAVRFADKFHRGQTRRGTGEPYYYHPIAVGLILVAYKSSKRLGELICSAILHDTIEDTGLSFEKIAKEFGSLVASLVLELTNDNKEIERVGKLAYHKKKLVGMSSYALYLKLADRLHNMSDQPSEKMVSETLELMDYLKKNRKLTKGQRAMVQEIIRLCKEPR
jgi:(p)ppGpp synthase/HD superfamily hydrolase